MKLDDFYQLGFSDYCLHLCKDEENSPKTFNDKKDYINTHTHTHTHAHIYTIGLYSVINTRDCKNSQFNQEGNTLGVLILLNIFRFEEI